MSKLFSLNRLKANIPIEVAMLPIKSSSFRVYFYLTARAGKKGVTWYSITDLAKDLRMDRKTVRSALVDLVDYNLIRICLIKNRYYFVIFYQFVQQNRPVFMNKPETNLFFQNKMKIEDWSQYIMTTEQFKREAV